MSHRQRILVIILLLQILNLSQAFVCPDNRQCYCFEELIGEHRVGCSTRNATTRAFDVQIQSHEKIIVECTNSPDWTDFMLGSALDIGNIRTVVFSSCTPPGKDNAKKVAQLLGVKNVERLKFNVLNGTLSKEDLSAYRDVKYLHLADNDLSNIKSDLFHGK